MSAAIAKHAARLGAVLRFDADDLRTLVGLALRGLVIVGAFGTLGLGIRVFIWTSGFGGN